MSTGFIGEIRMGGWNFAPAGWALCNGIGISIDQNQALFALIGTTYGGDGQTTFNLPNLQGRLPIHQGAGLVIGGSSGAESVTLTTAQLPSHNHLIMGNGTGGISTSPQGLAPAGTGTSDLTYNAPGNPVQMGNLLGFYGSSLPHENRMPFLAVTFVICLQGVFPSRN